MNSWSDFSSSANRTRKLLCGSLTNPLLLDRFGRFQRQPNRKRASPVGAGARCLYLALVLIDDAVANGQAQAGPLAGAAAREEGFEDVFEDLRRHAAARVRKSHFGHPVASREPDGQRAAIVHPV